MRDPRFERLAEILAGYSTELKRNEKVLIEAFDAPDEMTIALVRAVRKRGAIPFVQLQRARVSRELALDTSEPQLRLLARHELARMKQIAKKMRPIQDHRVQKTKWVVLRWPTPAMAQLASMSTEAFEDFFFEVCTLDYRKLQPGMNALKKLMERTDRVEIAGPGTDLRFSIKKIPAVICGGDRNIPDGEVFTAPVRDSVTGFVTFNAPTIYQGTSFDHIRLEFENGKIVKATSNQTKKLNDVLDADGGARYIGEFSLGFNPYILHPMRDILFDEKIAGSFHFTPGQAYETADNGNRSQVHWDMVNIQRREYGGGEIYFDGKLIRKNGEFVIPLLQPLNRARLLKRK